MSKQPRLQHKKLNVSRSRAVHLKQPARSLRVYSLLFVCVWPPEPSVCAVPAPYVHYLLLLLHKLLIHRCQDTFLRGAFALILLDELSSSDAAASSTTWANSAVLSLTRRCWRLRRTPQPPSWLSPHRDATGDRMMHFSWGGECKCARCSSSARAVFCSVNTYSFSWFHCFSSERQTSRLNNHSSSCHPVIAIVAFTALFLLDVNS